LEAPIRLGSESRVKDFWGNEHSHARANYGWARSGAQKHPTWIRADAFYGWYNF
jgi:hypothetical protein